MAALAGVVACSPLTPVTTVPVAMLSAYEKSKRREVWLQYANEGDVYAQYELAQSYCCAPMDGPGDGRESYRWFCAAAKNGYAKAQYALGQLHEQSMTLPGYPIAKEKITAYVWYSVAAKRLHEESRHRKKELEREFSPAEFEKAQALLKDWRKKLKCEVG